MDSGFTTFSRLMKHPVKFRMFLLSKLPSAYFTGVRIQDVNETTCVTTVRYKWFSKNPFRSTYFASLAMAAEMSTGALAQAWLYKRKPSVSMLLTKLEAEYFKKATGKTTFECHDGALFQKVIEDAVATGEPKTAVARSTGKNEAGDVVAEFFITWSFKARSPRAK